MYIHVHNRASVSTCRCTIIPSMYVIIDSCCFFFSWTRQKHSRKRSFPPRVHMDTIYWSSMHGRFPHLGCYPSASANVRAGPIPILPDQASVLDIATLSKSHNHLVRMRLHRSLSLSLSLVAPTHAVLTASWHWLRRRRRPCRKTGFKAILSYHPRLTSSPTMLCSKVKGMPISKSSLPRERNRLDLSRSRSRLPT